MKVELNGEATELPEGATVADAVAVVGARDESRGVAVAVSGEVVPRTQWGGRGLNAGDEIEVVRAVQGG